MFPDLSILPEWLLVGLLVGGLASVGVAVLFVVASRWFPSPAAPDSASRDGDRRRRDEIRAYLRAIEESFEEETTVAGQTVAFYLPARDVAITFDARAYYRIEATDTTAVLVEHEMPGVHLGARLPFEVPDLDFGPAATSAGLEPAVAAYRELGLSPEASADEVTAAYRDRVKEVHPDLGGDEDAFQRVREAYTTAKRYSAD